MPNSVKVRLPRADAIGRRICGLFQRIAMSSANAGWVSTGFILAVKIARLKRPTDKEWIKNLESVADGNIALMSGDVVRVYLMAILDGIHFLGSFL